MMNSCSHLLSGALDVDKLDYLPRDARACNVPYGGCRCGPFAGSFAFHPNVQGNDRIVVTHKGISPLHSLLHARQEMFDNIYWHHTSRALQVMLMRAVQEALLAGALQTSHWWGWMTPRYYALGRGTNANKSRVLAEDLELRSPTRGSWRSVGWRGVSSTAWSPLLECKSAASR